MNAPTALRDALGGDLPALWLTLALAGCASTVPSDPTTAPAQVIRALGIRQFQTRQESDPVFGLQGLKAHLEPAIERCRTSGGDLQVLKRTQVSFAARANALRAQQTELTLPQRLACRNSTGFLWGASLAYTRTTFFPSQWTGDLTYYADVQSTFASAEQLNLTEERGAANLAAAQHQRELCAEKRSANTALLRTKPEIGMQVAYGTIIDLRPPLALVQYDPLGRQLKGRDQEWVQVSSLSTGSDCP